MHTVAKKMIRPEKPKKMGELLIGAGIINNEQLERAIEKAKEGDMRIGEAFVALGLVTEEVIAMALSQQLYLPYSDCVNERVSPAMLELVSERFARDYLVLPVNYSTFIMADPLNYDVLKEINFIVGGKVSTVVSTPSLIKKGIGRNYNLHRSAQDYLLNNMPGTLQVEELEGGAFKELDGIDEEGKAKLIDTMLNSYLLKAVHSGASEVVIEPGQNGVHIRKSVEFPKWVQSKLLGRIKDIASLPGAEEGTELEGEFRLKVEDRDINIRIRTSPFEDGEKVILKFLVD